MATAKGKLQMANFSRGLSTVCTKNKNNNNNNNTNNNNNNNNTVHQSSSSHNNPSVDLHLDYQARHPKNSNKVI